jgi:hypothetical protein
VWQYRQCTSGAVDRETQRWITVNPLSGVEIQVHKYGATDIGMVHMEVMNPDMTPPATGLVYPGSFNVINMAPDPTFGILRYTFTDILPAGSTIGIVIWSTSASTADVRMFARGVVAI